MNLTTATKPIKEIITRTRKVCVKPASYLDKENGELQEVTITGVDGVKRVEERPITERVLLPPVFDEQDESVEIWVVETSYNGNIERHEFANKEDAIRYFGGFN